MKFAQKHEKMRTDLRVEFYEKNILGFVLPKPAIVSFYADLQFGR